MVGCFFKYLWIIFISLCVLFHHTWIASVIVGVILWGSVANSDILISYFNQLPHLLILYNAPRMEILLAILLLFYCLIVYFIKYFLVWQPIPIKFRNSRFYFVTFFLTILVLIQLYFIDIKKNNPLGEFIHSSKKNELDLNATEGAALRELTRLHQKERSRYQTTNLTSTFYKKSSDSNKNNVIIFITVDALRFDKLSLNGYQRETTPQLKKLSDNNFFNLNIPVRSTCAESICGIISLLSSAQANAQLSSGLTLFEILKYYGYQSHAILSGDHSNYYNLKEIYQHADSYFDGTQLPKDSYLNDDEAILRHIEKTSFSSSKSQFLYFHLMGVHSLGKRNPLFNVWQPYEMNFGRFFSVDFEILKTRYFNNYDNGVLQTDNNIIRIYSHIRRQLPNAKIRLIITADHGEFTGERGFTSHARSLYEPVLNTPLLLSGFQKPLLKRHATQQDIAPTILAELDIPIPATFTGTALQLKDDRPYTLHRQKHLYALVRKDGLKWIQNTQDGSAEVYDLNKDPEEFDNLFNSMDENSKRGFLQAFFSRKIGLIQ